MTAVVVPAGVVIDVALARELAAVRREIVEAVMRRAGRDGRPFPREVVEALDACASAASSASGSVPVPEVGVLPAVDDSGAWMSVADAAGVLGITPRAVRKARQEDRLPGRRRGGDTGAWEILRDAVEAKMRKEHT